jgi:hypothetical protein
LPVAVSVRSDVASLWEKFLLTILAHTKRLYRLGLRRGLCTCFADHRDGLVKENGGWQEYSHQNFLRPGDASETFLPAMVC